MKEIIAGLKCTGTFDVIVTEETITEMLADEIDIEDEEEVHEWLLDNVFCDITGFTSGGNDDFEINQEDLEKIIEKARKMEEEN